MWKSIVDLFTKLSTTTAVTTTNKQNALWSIERIQRNYSQASKQAMRTAEQAATIQYITILMKIHKKSI